MSVEIKIGLELGEACRLANAVDVEYYNIYNIRCELMGVSPMGPPAQQGYSSISEVVRHVRFRRTQIEQLKEEIKKLRARLEAENAKKYLDQIKEDLLAIRDIRKELTAQIRD